MEVGKKLEPLEQYLKKKKTIDETIYNVCFDLKIRRVPIEQYAETVKALAMLVNARANYKKENS